MSAPRSALIGAALLLLTIGASADPRDGDAALVSAWLDVHLDRTLETYRDIHRHPELSLAESRTAALAAARLRDAGYRVLTGIGGHSAVGVLTNGEGPVLLIRGDTDALPVTEDTGLPYASEVRVERPEGGSTGVMHACGHDLHTANLLAVAELLAGARDRWRGSLVIIAQPAEEIGRGARAMIEDGLFDRVPRPDYTLALHVEPSLQVGRVGVTSGWTGANVDAVDITIHGRGGHGARPHLAVDPIVTAAHLVTELQTLVSRRVDPLEPAVVTVGSIHGGHKHNVIPDEVHLQLTVRSYSDAVRSLLLDGIRQQAADVCRSFQCPKPPDVSIRKHYTPAVYSDPDLVARAVQVFRSSLGEDNVVFLAPSMGGDDFGRYARHLEVPGILFRVGSVDPETLRASRETGAAPLPSLHSARFAPAAEPALRTAITSMSRLALDLLARP